MRTLEETYFAGTTRTRISNAERTERDAGRRRHELVQAGRDGAEWHEATLRSLLTHKTDEKARAGLQGLLSELTEQHGLGWSEIARLVGVSVPAIRKWRRGGDITPSRLSSLARLAAFLEMLDEEAIRDAPAWLNMPFDDCDGGTSKSAIYAAGGALDLLLYAKSYIDYEELMRRSPVPAVTAPSRDALVMMTDGNLSIGSGSDR